MMGGAAFMTLLGFVGYFGQGRIHIGGGPSGYHRTASQKSKKSSYSASSMRTTSDSIYSSDTNEPTKARSSKKSSHKAPPSHPIKLNSATAEELQELPGIGPSISQRIVEYRTSHGSFHSIDDLLDVNGIGDKLFQRISPYLSL